MISVIDVKTSGDGSKEDGVKGLQLIEESTRGQQSNRGEFTKRNRTRKVACFLREACVAATTDGSGGLFDCDFLYNWREALHMIYVFEQDSDKQTAGGWADVGEMRLTLGPWLPDDEKK